MHPFVSDKVFGPESFTEDVYEDGVKNVALSALMGINGICSISVINNLASFSFFTWIFMKDEFNVSATIFAYGQTSSGKTYTMRGVTEKAVNDIYNHITKVKHCYDQICKSMFFLHVNAPISFLFHRPLKEISQSRFLVWKYIMKM